MLSSCVPRPSWFTRNRTKMPVKQKRYELRFKKMMIRSAVFLTVAATLVLFASRSQHYANRGIINTTFRICADLNQLSRRGTEVSSFDYMSGLKDMHGNYGYDYDVVFLISQKILDQLTGLADRENLSSSEPEVKIVFEKEFGNLIGYDDFSARAREVGCHMIYAQISGELASSGRYYGDPSRPLRIPVAVHAVFQTNEPHGTIFASISRQLSLETGQLARCKGNEDIYVDYIVDYKFDELVMNVEHMRISKRDELGIASDCLVLCRHGGYETFNIPFVRDNLVTIIDMLENVEVILMNTHPLEKGHSRIHEVQGDSSIEGKALYFAACDAMLHARMDGETFGLAVAEFSLRNKPVLTYDGILPGYARAHLGILQDRGLYYKDLSTLQALISSLVKNGIPTRDFNAYANYSRANILPKFERVFIKPSILWWHAARLKGIHDVWEGKYEDLPPLNKACDCCRNGKLS